jgi:hypothetical protein
MSHLNHDSQESSSASVFSSSVNNTIEVNNDYIRKSAKRLQKALKNHSHHGSEKNSETISPDTSYTLMQCQDIISQALGFENFHSAKMYNKSVEFSKLATKGIYAMHHQQDVVARTQGLHLIGHLSNTHDNLYLNEQCMQEHSLFVGDFNSGAFDAWFERLKLAIAPAQDGSFSPVIFYDTTGSYVVTQEVFRQAKAYNREDDVIVVNYMTGSLDVFGPQENKLSNTMNPFSYGSSGSLTELFYSMLDNSIDKSGEHTWRGRAIGLISTVMMALVYMRDNENFNLNVSSIRHYLGFSTLNELFKTRTDFPSHIQEAFWEYCRNMPAFNKKVKIQDQDFMDQHGFLQMQLIRVLGFLEDSYGYIFNTNLGEVDYRDLIANNRILVVCCPALEKSIDEMKILYQVHVASLKVLMAEALGQSIEIKNENRKKHKGFIFFNRGLEFLPGGCAVLPAQLRSAGLIPIIYERKMPTTLEGKSFAINMLHRFYFKGEYPNFPEAQRKLAANLKQGHCFYEPPMIIKDMESLLLMQYNIEEFRLLDM